MAIKLTPHPDGTYRENGSVIWVPDSYTEPRDSLFDCCVCDKPIEDWNLWTCMDGGEAAHNACVVIQNAH